MGFCSLNNSPHSIRRFLFSVMILSFLMLPIPLGAQDDFIRGDCLGDGEIQFGDLIYMLCIFCDPGPTYCVDACDADDDGIYDLPDAVYLLNYLFHSDVPPPAPFPSCGPDPTADSLACSNYQYDCQTTPSLPPLEPAFTMRIPEGFGAPGEIISIAVELEIDDSGNTMAACSFGVSHDSSALSFIGAEAGLDVEDVDYWSTQVHDGGWTTGIILSIIGQVLYSEGDYQLATAQYQVLGDVGEVTTLDFVDTLGEPTIETRIVPQWGPEVIPLTVAGSVTVTTAFRRADLNGDDVVDIGDPVWGLICLFSCFPSCLDAHDANDDGSWDIADPIYVLAYLFVGGDPPLPPFFECGADPTTDALDCEIYNSCP